MRLFEILLDESDFTEGIQAISLVGDPAMESNWLTLAKQKLNLKSVDDEKHILMGAVLIPDKPILRLDSLGDEFHIFFKAETIEKALHMYALNGNHNQATVEHMNSIGSTVVVETWIKTDPKLDKSNAFGFDEPVGTWFAMMKVTDLDLWDNFIKTGALTGFSIEGFFGKKLVENLSSMVDQSPCNKMEQIIDILKQVDE